MLPFGFRCHYLASNAMKLGSGTVENPKTENEKVAQKRQFRDFASQKLHSIGSGFGRQKNSGH